MDKDNPITALRITLESTEKFGFSFDTDAKDRFGLYEVFMGAENKDANIVVMKKEGQSLFDKDGSIYIGTVTSGRSKVKVEYIEYITGYGESTLLDSVRRMQSEQDKVGVCNIDWSYVTTAPPATTTTTVITQAPRVTVSTASGSTTSRLRSSTTTTTKATTTSGTTTTKAPVELPKATTTTTSTTTTSTTTTSTTTTTTTAEPTTTSTS
ncbi:MAG: hypothetical protein K2I00_09430, partial [Ruminococcus sp.]|nr:hypothetical protein [Ruminococcus sp.]